MCGRYALNISGEDLALEFAAGNANVAMTASNWNISPTTPIPFVAADNEGGDSRQIQMGRWGLIPSWAKDASRQSNAINARVESIAEKPTFKSAFKSRRCLIPATGYYEWATSLGKYPPKQPFYITSAAPNKSLSIAGIWSTWKNEKGEEIQSAAIITREAVGELATIHSRMPVFMERAKWSDWLDPKNREIEDLIALMQNPDPAAGLVTRPVSSRVNLVANNGPELIAEIELGEAQTLF